MGLSNHEWVGRALDAFRAGLEPWVRSELVRLYAAKWQQKARGSLSPLSGGTSGELHLDVHALTVIILDDRHVAFAKLRTPTARNWVLRVRAARNTYAHQRTFSDLDVDGALVTMELVLEAIGSTEAETVRKLRQRQVSAVLAVAAPRLQIAVPTKRSGPATVGVLEPNADGYARAVRLFQYLASLANRGQAIGVGYSAFIEYIHDKPFDAVMGRPYAQSDTGTVVQIAHEVTRRANRIKVARGSTTINAGMDTFIWPLKKPHERSDSSWKLGLPYTKQEWRKVFPDDLRKLLTPDELASKIKA